MLGCEQIKAVFEHEFGQSHTVVLAGGAEEPVYLPAEDGQPARLVYTRNYPASALHEIAHWCLARDEQLALKDWGLWYVPDGRSAPQQQAFQQAEARVQAVEWLLSVAAGRPFRESSDNLSGEATDDIAFKDAIYQFVMQYCTDGLPARAAQLYTALAQESGSAATPAAQHFRRETLDRMLRL